MTINKKITLLVFFAILSTSLTYAQMEGKWEVGGGPILTTMQGEGSKGLSSLTGNIKPGFGGIQTSYSFPQKAFFLRGQLLNSRFSNNDIDSTTTGRATGANLQLGLFLNSSLGVLLGPKMEKKWESSPFQLFALVGAGYHSGRINSAESNPRFNFSTVPFGLGIRFTPPSSKFTFAVEGNYNIVFSDLLDNSIISSANDRLIFGALSVNYRLGNTNRNLKKQNERSSSAVTQDSTHEPPSVVAQDSTHEPSSAVTQDSMHKPPSVVAQDSTYKPSSAVTQDSTYKPSSAVTQDSIQKPPSVVAQDSTYKSQSEVTKEHDGDGDGVMDSNDKCPYQKGSEKANGCPDLDNDGIPDNKDLDIDGDNIANNKDLCPRERNFTACGCKSDENPRADTDKDGIINRDDCCPCAKAGTSGCPDGDGDGVADCEDKCPGIKGLRSKKGCKE